MMRMAVRSESGIGRGLGAGAAGPVRVAALDVGSNSFHLVVVEAVPGGKWVVLDRAKEMVRLGAATLRDGVIPDETMERAIEALKRLRQVVDRHSPEAVLAVATSAVREARNGGEFLRAAEEATGFQIRMIDGLEEARIIFAGARTALRLGTRRVALFDVGGGSTEIIVGDAMEMTFATSLKLGVLRYRDLIPCSDPCTAAEVMALGQAVRRIIEPAAAQLRQIPYDFVAFSSGTALTLSRLAETLGGEDAEDSAGMNETRLTLQGLRSLEGQLATLTIAQRAALPGMDPKRADTILPGVVILRALMEASGARAAIVCEAALREGLVADYLERRARETVLSV